MKNVNTTSAIIPSVVGHVRADELKGVEKAVAFLNDLRKVAVKEEIRATAALNSLLKKYPSLKRTETCKAAVLVGINNRTACNIWDAVRHG
jgi:hypothetical protein